MNFLDYVSERERIRLNPDFLPIINFMRYVEQTYSNAVDVVGGMLYKITRDKTLEFTDLENPVLQRIYEEQKSNVDEIMPQFKKAFKCLEEYGNNYKAIVLSGSFAYVFGMTYLEWKESLKRRNK